MSYYTYSFEKLDVWKLPRKNRNEIYELSARFPNDEKFGLISQIKRSSNGIADNLAEGSGRATSNDRAYFTNIAYSSALETVNHLITCLDQHYITQDEYESQRLKMDELINKLNAYYRHQLNEGKSVKERFR